MAFADNFGNPQGFLGRLMLVAMEREHLPMAKWAFSLFDVPQEGQIADIERGFKEVRRGLKDGAAFAVVNNYGDPKIDWEKKVPCMKRRTAEEIKELLLGAGFSSATLAQNGNLFCVMARK